MNPETQSVDVLAVIDAQIAITARPHEAGLFDARAAVAELIAAVTEYETECANPVMDPMLKRRRRHEMFAALARIGAKP